ncbi:MAG: 30S ribosomal protein S18 [bacterium]|jgi:small subunit ribosomal protein S18|nr:30S ribosomal protein S18 [bacterium]MDT8366027.1 30S ribosomal protein S18 [bacterium]
MKRRFSRRRKVCHFCVDKVTDIDYKNVRSLKRYITERGKILPSRISGNCAKHQRKLTAAIKKSRNIALLPFAIER